MVETMASGAQPFHCCRPHRVEFCELLETTAASEFKKLFCIAAVLLAHTEPILLLRFRSAVFLLSLLIEQTMSF